MLLMRDMAGSEQPKSDEPSPENSTYLTSVPDREAFLPETILHPSSKREMRPFPRKYSLLPLAVT
jgi:hypothetical protein